MSKIHVLNDKFENSGELELPASYAEVNPHNLYLYVKSYLAGIRANSAHTKSRAFVSGGMKSMAVKVILQDMENTLTDETVESVIGKLIDAATAAGAQLRS